MSFLNELIETYGVNDKRYNRSVAILKEKLRHAYSNGWDSCEFFDAPYIIERIMKDPEFEGFKFEEPKSTATKDGNIGKKVCW